MNDVNVKEIDSKINKVLEYLIKNIPTHCESIKYFRIDSPKQHRSFLDEHIFPLESKKDVWYKQILINPNYRSDEKEGEFIEGLKDVSPADRIILDSKSMLSRINVRLSDGLVVDLSFKQLELITVVFRDHEQRYNLQNKLRKVCGAWRQDYSYQKTHI